ncbi:DUF1128 domain-containing protein [Mechercharimyces sp. CAU 1602]|uniref:DUF1128 domain-containing protein n=1 Tax=Mechercharimyces sp. CAU 1602 TaxID=2973933 RepID=UPI002163664E|nr:DUF1128 domain-containing protein [Mechercharimyces sp. CAU 1602]MCS1351946.1 DUF1128 domain-containing protein [Mechercharimyces sp. CAU 1602]
MNLGEPNKENMHFMIENMKTNLRVVNGSIISAEDFNLDQYEDIYDLYRLVEKKKGKMTTMELEGILAELASMRKITDA